ncbi:MAG: DUF3037 domain-containing protein [Bacteroidota bacterium]|nr:DUF3037 domain-containing protein [Bacteroidota bacterium]
MHGQLLYEYAVIRFVPHVEREEFLNVGVIVFCKEKKYVKVLFHIDIEKLRVLAPDSDVNELKEYLEAFAATASGNDNGGPIAKEDAASRFRWLTAVRSSSIQTSRPHPGFCTDLEATIKRLLEELVK